MGEGVILRFERRVNANADLDSLATRFAVEARTALQEHLAALFEAEAAPPENSEEQSANPLPPEEQQEDSSSYEPVLLPSRISEACREELAEENTARHDWIAQEGRQQRDVYGFYQRTADFRISTTDPDTTPMRLKGGGIHPGYHTRYVVDEGKRRIILAVLVVPGKVMDNHPILDLLWHVFFIPFHREEQTHIVEYRAVAGTCNSPPVKAACTTNKRGRHIHRSFFADYLDRVKSYEQTLAYHKARNLRKVWIEPRLL